MDTTQTRITNVMTLSPEDVSHYPFAFESKSNPGENDGQLAKVLASSFLKYSSHAQKLTDGDGVESFIQLYMLYNELMEAAESFLCDEVPFVQDNRPLNELLLGFATYRLTRASRVYYFESLTARAVEDIDTLRQVIRDCQLDFDNLLQSI